MRGRPPHSLHKFKRLMGCFQGVAAILRFFPVICLTVLRRATSSAAGGAYRSKCHATCADILTLRASPSWRPLWCLRARSLTDDLVDLLIETIHQIGARAERKVERELWTTSSVSPANANQIWTLSNWHS
jgi:hypothetical protein